MSSTVRRAIGLVGAAAVLAGCVSTNVAAPSTSTITEVTTRTITHSPSARATASYRPAAATTVVPLPPDASPGRGEVDKRCPYIASSPDQNPSTNVADIDGSHVYRTTVLTGLTPLGCRFYFYTAPYYAIVDIVPKRFGTARQAYAAMIATANAGTQVMGKKNIVAGVDAVLYRTKFYGADGAQDWACVFAARRTMVVVHTQQTNTSLNALLLAQAVAGRF